MVKRLKLWNGIYTTLRVGNTIYQGQVVKDEVRLSNDRSCSMYYFKTDGGERIRIKSRGVIAKEGGLVLKTI